MVLAIFMPVLLIIQAFSLLMNPIFFPKNLHIRTERSATFQYLKNRRFVYIQVKDLKVHRPKVDIHSIEDRKLNIETISSVELLKTRVFSVLKNSLNELLRFL